MQMTNELDDDNNFKYFQIFEKDDYTKKKICVTIKIASLYIFRPWFLRES